METKTSRKRNRTRRKTLRTEKKKTKRDPSNALGEAAAGQKKGRGRNPVKGSKRMLSGTKYKKRKTGTVTV